MKKTTTILLKHFTITNLIIGGLTMIFAGLIRYSGLPFCILSLLGFTETSFNEYIIVGFLSLITRLGLKGIVESIIPDNFFMTMGGPNEGESSSSPKPLATGATNTNATGSGSRSTPEPLASGAINATDSGNSATNNTAGSGSSNTNTTGSGSSAATNTTNPVAQGSGLIEVDSNPNSPRPDDWWDTHQTEAQQYNCDPSVLDIFDDPDLRYRYLAELKKNNNQEYKKLKGIFSKLAFYESKLKTLKEQSYVTENWNTEEKRQKFAIEIAKWEKEIEELKKDKAPQINGRPIGVFVNNNCNIFLVQKREPFSFSPEQKGHKRNHSTVLEELSKRSKLADNNESGRSLNKGESSSKGPGSN